MHPLIKWTGSKRYLAETIVSYFPQDIDTYYEPFVAICIFIFGIANLFIK